jgi:hypothetical protein
MNYFAENQTLILFTTLLAVFGIVFFKWLNNRGKYLVRIKADTEKTFYRKPELNSDGMSVLIEKPKNKPEWRVKYTKDSVYIVKSLFGSRRTIDVLAGSRKAIDFKDKDVYKNELTIEEAAKIARLDGFKVRFGNLKLPNPMVYYAILILVIANLVFQFLQMRGIRIV